MPVFGLRIYFLLPAIRLSCNSCHVSFVWQYDCVAPKKRYTKLFEASLPKHAIGATITHAARITETQATTLNRVVSAWMETESERVQQVCQEQAAASTNLVLGIDDFAIRKGHSYNNGLHDLRNHTFLDVIPVRTVEELLAYYANHPTWCVLQPYAVVMDLAKSYHTFIQTTYPHAIRIADRFHVNRYVTEALQDIQKLC